MSDERRKEKRTLRSTPAKAEIITSQFSELVGKTAAGKTIDVSKGALRLELDQPVPVGGQLGLWVEKVAGDGQYYVTGNVLWARDEGGVYQIGVELFEGQATDIDNWRADQA